MPLFIRECDLEKESSFVAGFSPEMAWIEEKISDGPQEANVMGESSQEAAVSSTNCDLGVIVTDSRESVQRYIILSFITMHCESKKKFLILL